MHYLSLIPLSLLSLLVTHVSAIRFPIQARSVKRSGTGLTSRATAGGISTIKNTHNAEYIANITLGGKEIPVMLDTGRYVLRLRSRGVCIWVQGLKTHHIFFVAQICG